MSDTRLLHAGAWAAWVGAVLVVVTTTRNPWYLGFTLLWIGVVGWAASYAARATNESTDGSTDDTFSASILSPWRFALVVVPLAALFNALFVHVGSTRLFVLPASIPIIGGPVTLEAIVYGALNGVVLTALFAAFALFNRVTPLRDLIRLAPSAYHPIAVTVAIALTYVPVTLRQARQISEAQALRGNRIKGLRDWVSLFLPLLSSGLERALLLAEAMVARGFASAAQPAGMMAQMTLVLGLVLLLAGWMLRLVWSQPLLGGAIMLGGAVLLVGALWVTGRATVRTVYRPAQWRSREWIVVAAALAAIAIFLVPVPGVDRATLYFTPYPTLGIPDLSLLLGVATWALLAPALVLLTTPPADT